ncbi:hypothetical protein RDI58_028726 [Solanum bulbocastanum]|uniref:Uncharacterized protein n=1 Tax=Solanum bulbocastanum TaxID=147425 RepID=A0AAN8Y1F8_SOLBU
MGRKILNMDR